LLQIVENTLCWNLMCHKYTSLKLMAKYWTALIATNLHQPYVNCATHFGISCQTQYTILNLDYHCQISSIKTVLISPSVFLSLLQSSHQTQHQTITNTSSSWSTQPAQSQSSRSSPQLSILQIYSISGCLVPCSNLVRIKKQITFPLLINKLPHCFSILVLLVSCIVF
jgi:hypothetical protein